jgi:aspartate/methionine/tyrosine aminotransferase
MNEYIVQLLVQSPIGEIKRLQSTSIGDTDEEAVRHAKQVLKEIIEEGDYTIREIYLEKGNWEKRNNVYLYYRNSK